MARRVGFIIKKAGGASAKDVKKKDKAKENDMGGEKAGGK